MRQLSVFIQYINSAYVTKHGVRSGIRIHASNANEWPRWIKRFEHYRIASGFDKQSSEFQVNSFMFVAGDDAEVLSLTDEPGESPL